MAPWSALGRCGFLACDQAEPLGVLGSPSSRNLNAPRVSPKHLAFSEALATRLHTQALNSKRQSALRLAFSEEPYVDAIVTANKFQVKGHILEKARFIDRNKELREAMIICKQIVGGGTGGVLIVGGKGVGKSSLIEAIMRELVAQRIITSKINLDDSWVAQGKESQFFRTIIAELTRNAAEQGFLEKSKAESIIGALLRHLKIEEVRAEFPFISVAASVGEGNQVEEFPSIYFRDALKELLAKVREKSQTGLVICMDEGDALTKNRILLQVLKNVFQDTPGAGIVLAGTNELLMHISSMFSPLLRFVQRLDLGPYDSPEALIQAIEVPLELTKQALLDQELHVEFEKQPYGGSSFVGTVERISARMPLDVNLLCHYAIKSGAKRATRVGSTIIVPMKIDYPVTQSAIGQLVGTKEYESLIQALDSQEEGFLQMLGQADFRVTIEELALLIHLNEMGRNVQTTPIAELSSEIEGFKEDRETMMRLVQSISEKASRFGIDAIKTGITSTGGLIIDDQWLRAYFKFSVPKIWYDLEASPNIPYTGIRFYNDPVASIIHSIFFPRFGRSIMGKAEYHAHQHAGRTDFLTIERDRKLLLCLYRRVADGRMCHLAFQLKKEADTAEWIEGINIILGTLQKQGIINLYERCREQRQTIQSPRDRPFKLRR